MASKGREPLREGGLLKHVQSAIATVITEVMYTSRRHRQWAKFGVFDIFAFGSHPVLEGPFADHGDDIVEDAGILACMLCPGRHV